MRRASTPGQHRRAEDRHAPDAFDRLERRPPEERERQMLAALPDLLRHAMAGAPALAEHLAGIDPAGVTSLAALAALPVLRKGELSERQRARRSAG